MKKNIILFLLLMFSSRALFAIGDFYIAPIKNSNSNNEPLRVCKRLCHEGTPFETTVYYPSRLFDENHRERGFVVYDLYGVYLDSCSAAHIKTVNVKIPNEFKGVRCRVGTTELVYSFQTKDREILVYIPTTEKDTLNCYECCKIFSYPFSDPKLDVLIHKMPRANIDIREKHYLGIKQNGSYAIYYYNFSKKQNKCFLNNVNNLVL